MYVASKSSAKAVVSNFGRDTGLAWLFPFSSLMNISGYSLHRAGNVSFLVLLKLLPQKLSSLLKLYVYNIICSNRHFAYIKYKFKDNCLCLCSVQYNTESPTLTLECAQEESYVCFLGTFQHRLLFLSSKLI